jgi:nitrogen fixation protein NifU and related proteins
MDDLEQLYQDIILDHYKNPRNRATLRDDEVLADEENPMCGDQIRLTARVEDGRIVDVRYDGKGCAISQASASMMTEVLKGRTTEEAQALIAAFVRTMRGEQEFDTDTPEDLLALSGVKKFPLRVKCATMSWHGMEKVLGKLGAEKS